MRSPARGTPGPTQRTLCPPLVSLSLTPSPPTLPTEPTLTTLLDNVQLGQRKLPPLLRPELEVPA